MPTLKNITGERFGRWIVLSQAESSRDGRGYPITRWNVRCDCGKEKVVRGSILVSGDSQSCGCLHREITAAIGRYSNLSHGMTKRPEYHIWNAIKDRCYNQKVESFKYYGARGIGVCDKWRNSFVAFFQDMGPRPQGTTIERLDGTKDYGPDNCVWATAKQQRLNQKNRVIWVRVKGADMCLGDAAIQAGVKPSTAYRRYHAGWHLEDCLRPVV